MAQLRESEKVFLRSGEEKISVIIAAAGAPRTQPTLEPILQDIPLAMLDINGKPLLQRNVEMLHRCQLHDITVVTGYRSEAFNVEGVDYVHNPRYDSEHILTSIMTAEDRMDGKTLIIYSDILFEDTLIDKLKSVEADFTVVVDNSFGRTLQRNKKLDLVVTREAMPAGKRRLSFDRLYTVERIGEEAASPEHSAEFIGIVLLSARGAKLFREEYARASEEFASRPFGRAASIYQAGLVDFLNYLIGRGHTVKAFQVNWGWTEIHTFDNYRYACSITRGL